MNKKIEMYYKVDEITNLIREKTTETGEIIKNDIIDVFAGDPQKDTYKVIFETDKRNINGVYTIPEMKENNII